MLLRHICDYNIYNKGIMTILYVIAMSWFITNFEPFERLIQTIKSNNILWLILKEIVICWKCNVFWLTLTLAGISHFIAIPLDVNILDAFAASMIASILDLNFNNKTIKLN